MSNADKILKLKELLDKDIITKEEFENKKAELLNQNKDNNNSPKTNKITKKDKEDIKKIILAILIIGIIFVIGNFLFKPSNSYSNRELLIKKYNLSQEEANKVIEIIDNCGYSNYYSNYKLEKGMDNSEIENSIGFEIMNGKNIVGFVDIKDNVVYQIQYSDKFLYQNGAIQHNLSEYLITSDEKSFYIFQTEEAIKQILQAPSTAKFPWDYNEYNVKKKDGSVIVQGYVDSQNGFGAMLRSTYQVTYTNSIITSLIFDGEEFIK